MTPSQNGGNLVSQVLRGGFTDLLGNEELLVEALRDLLKEELKGKMRAAIDQNPEVRAEMSDAVRMYFEAKVREAYATVKFVKASAKLGVEMMPHEMRQELGKEVADLLEREVAALLEKSM